MYLNLQQKPFYFLTDRTTHYQYLVDNRDKASPKKHLYYPEEYQTMSSKTLEKTKNSSVYKLLKWSLTNQQKLQFNDKKVTNSVLVNLGIMTVAFMLGAKYVRRLLFRIESPVWEIRLERIGMNVRWLKMFGTYVTFTWIWYNYVRRELRHEYLIDLAYEYRYHFDKKFHSKADQLYEKLWLQRIKANTKADQVV